MRKCRLLTDFLHFLRSQDYAAADNVTGKRSLDAISSLVLNVTILKVVTSHFPQPVTLSCGVLLQTVSKFLSLLKLSRLCLHSHRIQSLHPTK